MSEDFCAQHSAVSLDPVIDVHHKRLSNTLTVLLEWIIIGHCGCNFPSSSAVDLRVWNESFRILCLYLILV